jgi:nucleoside-diphosphate-sugar epimerase
MKILVTGAFGTVGVRTLEQALSAGHTVTAFDLDTHRNLSVARQFRKQCRIVWGDIRDFPTVSRVVEGQDCILHLAAVIPPAAIADPLLAENVNVEGTRNLISAAESLSRPPRLVFASSVAVYGDRLDSPLIWTTDEPCPNPDDAYAHHKLRCEALLKSSSLDWLILRLTYIVSARHLTPHPLMFEMPLETSIEICDARDAGAAFVRAAERTGINRTVLNIAGGPRCRISYGDYLGQMMEIFGIGWNALPRFAFSRSGFHCGFMDTTESQSLLGYQSIGLDDFFLEVRRLWDPKKFVVRLFRPLIIRWILGQSPYYRNATGGRLSGSVAARA